MCFTSSPSREFPFKNTLNKCIILVLLLRIAKIVYLCQVLVQVLGAAGLVKVKGETACTARRSVCDDLAKGFIGVGISLKMSPKPATFGTLAAGGRKVSLGTSALVLDMVNGTGGGKQGKCG